MVVMVVMVMVMVMVVMVVVVVAKVMVVRVVVVVVMVVIVVVVVVLIADIGFFHDQVIDQGATTGLCLSWHQTALLLLLLSRHLWQLLL